MSDFIFKSDETKGRLVRKEHNWFVAEYKDTDMQNWFPWVAGTKEFLQLTDQEMEWAIK